MEVRKNSESSEKHIWIPRWLGYLEHIYQYFGTIEGLQCYSLFARRGLNEGILKVLSADHGPKWQQQETQIRGLNWEPIKAPQEDPTWDPNVGPQKAPV